MEQKRRSLASSFGFAFSGIWRTIKKERNLKIHLFITGIVILAGLYFGISSFEWLVLTLAISTVLAAEIFNSALEEACNIYDEKLSLKYGETALPRNLSAGAVLVLTICSVILGILIFLPYIILLI